MDLTEPRSAISQACKRRPLPKWKDSTTHYEVGSVPKHAKWESAARSRFELLELLDAELWAACEQLEDRAGLDLAGFDKDERRRPLLGRFAASACKSYWVPLLGAALLVDLLREVPLHGWTLHLHDDLRKTRASFWADPRSVAPFEHAAWVVLHGASASELRKRVQRFAKRAKHHPRDTIQPWMAQWQRVQEP